MSEEVGTEQRFKTKQTGQQYINDFIYLFYNVLFTASPVIVMAVLDQALNRNQCENNPKAYNYLLGGRLFNRWTFAMWIFRCFRDAAIIYYFSRLTFGEQNISVRRRYSFPFGVCFLGGI